MKLDLHLHTNSSFDGFTTVDELVERRNFLGIDFIGLTEHDVINQENRLESKNFLKGCEFTSSSGTHIIGLDLNYRNIPINMNSISIIKYIKDQKGIVIIPHPFKPDTGLLANLNEQFVDDALLGADLIELYNGGYTNSLDEHVKIKKIANSYNLGMLASSDSHKVNQIGLYLTKIYFDNKRNFADNLKFSPRKFFFDANRLGAAKRNSWLNKMKKHEFYQFLLNFFPRKARRIFKTINYKMSSGKIKIPCYRELKD